MYQMTANFKMKNSHLKKQTKKKKKGAMLWLHFWMKRSGRGFAHVPMLYSRGMLLLLCMHSHGHSTHIHASNTKKQKNKIKIINK